MFNEDDDWSDEGDAQVLSKTVIGSTQKASSSTKAQVVGKKSLLRTLQTLGSVPEWKNDDHQENSDSDTEAEVVASPTKKKKKKKKKKRKRAPTTTGEEQDDGDLDQTVNGETLATKKRKKDTFAPLKLKTPPVSKTTDNGIIKSKPEDTEGLSRKQWKNKMKNKRKCTNKFSQKEPERKINKAESAEQHEPKKEVKIDSYSNNNNNSQKPAKKKEKQSKPQKMKKAQENTDISGTTDTQTLDEEKQQIVGRVGKDATESSADGPKQKADVPQVENAGELHQPPVERPKPELSREQILKREKLRKLLNRQEPVQRESPAETKVEPAETKVEPAAPEEEVKPDRSASLRSRMELQLDSARFRYINEVLYSTSSGEAKRMFKQDPEAFEIYHRGYTAQVQRWPANPVDAIISYIRQKPPSLVVADFGCGDCKIACSVKNKVHSFDFVATCKLVTVCDMADVPLQDGSVDIAVFCLSLMGTNLGDFLAEANRVLKKGGVLKIAEVASRFENVRNFISALGGLGFKIVTKDTKSTHFYSFELLKTGEAPENIKKFGLQLRPCVYKKR